VLTKDPELRTQEEIHLLLNFFKNVQIFKESGINDNDLSKLIQQMGFSYYSDKKTLF
jgi:hypothetical protein